MQPKEKHRKIPHRILILALSIYLCFSLLPTTDGFIAFDHPRQVPEHIRRHWNNLIRRVHKEQWTIGYTYADNCPPEKRKNGKAIEEAITMSLNAWLQPVRDMNMGRPVVDDFRIVPDLVFPLPEAELQLYDLTIGFFCDLGKSHAWVGTDEATPPHVELHRGTVVTDRFVATLLHEIGHAFGLSDTYRRLELTLEELRVSRGGLERTIGHQPASVMAGHNFPLPVGSAVSQDDANGIVWLYRFYHEDLALEDCIFGDYELEKDPDGCRPKYPLIFEIIHGSEELAIRVIDEDENTDINVKDGNGLTALHHAFIKGYPKLVDRLLSHQAIEVNLQDESGLTALHYAVKARFPEGVEALLAHEGIDVNLQDESGMTALHYAVKGRFPQAVEWLLGREDIDIEVEDKDGVTAVALANQLGYTELADLISPPVEAQSVRLRDNLATVWGALKMR